MDIQNPETNSFLRMLNGQIIRWAVYDIPPWNMQTSFLEYINVSETIDMSKIFFLNGWIRDDDGDSYYCIPYINVLTNTTDLYFRALHPPTHVVAAAITDTGIFNDPAFSSTAFNRGRLFIAYGE